MVLAAQFRENCGVPSRWDVRTSRKRKDVLETDMARPALSGQWARQTKGKEETLRRHRPVM
jgi:hypothetical protein